MDSLVPTSKEKGDTICHFLGSRFATAFLTGCGGVQSRHLKSEVRTVQDLMFAIRSDPL